MNMKKFTKKLGQNFMINNSAIEKIVGALGLSEKDTVIEIGAGSGNLTGELFKKTKKIIAIEKDGKWLDELKKKFDASGNQDRIKIVEADARDVLVEITKDLGDYKIVGNVPYYLTGQLLRMIQELDNPPQLVVLTIQKEVAERLVVRDEDVNQLSAITGLWANVEILFHLKPGDFNPAPKVSSSVVLLKVFPKERRSSYENWVIDLIKIGFQHPRKTLLNNLSIEFNEKKIKNAFEQLNFTDRIRPHNLSVDLWIKLAKILYCF